MAMPTTVAEQWMYARLSGDTALNARVDGRIFPDAVPQNETFPAVTFAFQSGTDEYGVGLSRYWTEMTYIVKATGRADAGTDLEALADRIEAALSGAVVFTTANGEVFYCFRESPVSYTEDDGGVEYRHLGGLYRIAAL